MPKVYHRKSFKGCFRCRARRVKCDEARPKCTACSRHDVECVYPASGSGSTSYNAHEELVEQICAQPTEVTSIAGTELELRLLHYFTAFTSQGLTSVQDFWRIWGPLIAFRDRSVFDGMMALSALHLYQQTAETATQSNSASINREEQETAAILTGTHAIFLGSNTREQIRQASMHYFQRAVQGHREALNNLDQIDFEAAYMASTLIMGIAFFLHSGSVGVDLVESADERLWFTLGGGPRRLVLEGIKTTGKDFTRTSGLMYDHPDLSDDAHLFDAAHRAPFEPILSWAADFESLEAEDKLAYEKAASYIGLMIKGLLERTDSPLATSRRIFAAPSCLPVRFCEMVLEQRPRALALLAHLYAVVKLLSTEISLYIGTSERAIPSICDRIPPAWRQFIAWPLAIVEWDAQSGEPLPELAYTDPIPYRP